MLQQKVDGFLSGFERKERPHALEGAFVAEAVFTGHIAVMGGVEAHSLDDGAPPFQHIHGNLGIVGIQHLIVNKVLNIFHGFQQVFSWVPGGKQFCDLVRTLFLIIIQDIVNQIIHDVYGAAVDIQYDIPVLIMVFMNHFLFSYALYHR
jgi:hypothetical protein